MIENDDYLWDRSGTPDAEIQRLEKTLGRLAHEPRALELPAREVEEEFAGGAAGSEAPERALEEAANRKRHRASVAPGRSRTRWSLLVSRPAALAAAAALLVVLGVGWWTSQASRKTGWSVVRLDGLPRVGKTEVHRTARLSPGAWLETDADSRARVEVGDIGEVTLEPSSRLRLVAVAAGDQRMSLARGKLHAFIVAPPRSFTVETPSANAVDLGCAYTLEVADDGAARVDVTSGWVSFAFAGREVFIPAGARCDTRPGLGPGTPYRGEAAADLRDALATLDDPATDASARERSLATVLAAASPEDALTLWHLLARLGGNDRAAVYDRLAALAPPPAGVTRAGVLAGDRAMLDQWWDTLGFGEMEWWRMWQGDWPS